MGDSNWGLQNTESRAQNTVPLQRFSYSVEVTEQTVIGNHLFTTICIGNLEKIKKVSEKKTKKKGEEQMKSGK